MSTAVFVDALGSALKDLKRKYQIPSETMAPFQTSVTKKAKIVAQEKLEQDETLRLMEPVNRELAKQVYKLDQQVEKLLGELESKRRTVPEQVKKLLEDRWEADDPTRTAEEEHEEVNTGSVEVESGDEVHVEGLRELKELASENEKLCSELASGVTSTFTNLQTTIDAVSRGIKAEPSKVDLIMQGREEELTLDGKPQVEDDTTKTPWAIHDIRDRQSPGVGEKAPRATLSARKTARREKSIGKSGRRRSGLRVAPQNMRV